MGGKSVFELGILISYQDKASQGVSNLERRLRSLDGSVKSHAGMLGRLSYIHENIIDPARRIGDVWHRQAESLRKYTDAALDLSRVQQKFFALNLSAEDNAKAFDAVRHTVQKLNGVSLAEATETVMDLHTAIGSLDEAIEALPIASKYRFAFSTMFGDKFDAGALEQNIQSGFKFLEMIGAVRATGPTDAATGKHAFTDEDRRRMEEFFSRTAQMTAASGGRVTPADMFQMAQTGGTAMQGLTLEGLTHLQSPLTEMGGSRTGTALQTLFQNVVAGRMQQKGLMEWQRLGLLDTSKVEFNKSGIVRRMDAGAIPIGDFLQEDPLKFADALADAMKKHGVDTSNPKAVIKELGALKMPRTAMEITSLLINQRDRVLKETAIVLKAKGIEALNTQALDTAQGKIIAFEKTMENFRAATGMPLVELGSRLLGSWSPFINLLTEHPNLTLGLVGVQKVGVGLLETATLLKMSGLTDWLFKSTKGANALAEATTKVSRQAGFLSKDIITNVGVTGIPKAEKQLGGWMSRLSNIPSSVTTTLAVASAVGGVLLSAELISAMRQNARDIDDISKKSQDVWDNYITSGYAFNPRTPPEVQQTVAKSILEDLNKDQALEVALSDKPEFAWRGVFAADRPYGAQGPLSGWNQFDPNKAGGMFKNMAKALADPGVMMSAIRQVRQNEMGLTKEGQEKLLKSFEVAQPEAFKQASAMLDELSKSAQPVVTGFNDVYKSTGILTPSIYRTSNALDRFAFKLDNFSPSFGPVPIGGYGLPSVGGNTSTQAPPALPLNRPSTFDSSGFKRAHASLRAPLAMPPTQINQYEPVALDSLASLLRPQPQAYPALVEPRVRRDERPDASLASLRAPIAEPRMPKALASPSYSARGGDLHFGDINFNSTGGESPSTRRRKVDVVMRGLEEIAYRVQRIEERQSDNNLEGRVSRALSRREARA
ncbi:MAG TPA: hypothetical protein VE732_06620 [Nitrososphaera sp.]|jgi:hypothetical protein|nr:hypothetical protein [Nitrososphaera sp.]